MKHEMITPSEALQLISEHALTQATEIIPLEKALGRVSASAWLADSDLPPFHRVMMDGIAVRFSELENGINAFRVVDVQQAGEAAKHIAESCTCLEVMTGAVCPVGADAVIPCEQLRIENGVAYVFPESIKPWMNVHTQGSDFKQGATLLPKNAYIGIAEIGIAASVGMERVEVLRHPRVAIVSTGNELVEIAEKPAPFQIRRSNAYALKAMLQTAGCQAQLYHIADNKSELLFQLNEIMRSADVLLLSGGVSKGKFDMVPEVLETLQILPVFHRIAQKPGKPMWFGAGAKHAVFAFPGNPVSTLLCASRYFLPWWKLQFGLPHEPLAVISQSNYIKKGKLAMFVPCQLLNSTNGSMYATLVTNNGSGDFASLAGATGFIEIPADKSEVAVGDVLHYWPMHL